jgi:hypothetical protein
VCSPGTTDAVGCDICSTSSCDNTCQWGTCSLLPGNECEWQGGYNHQDCVCTQYSCGASQWQWCLSSCFWSTDCACCDQTGCTPC